jgi:nicotinate phosphoribosyltransferase
MPFDLQSLDEITDKSLRRKDGSSTCEDFVHQVQTWLSKIQVLRYNKLHP